MTTSAVIGYVVVPVGLFILGGIVTGVIGIIKLAGHMARSEAAQQATATSNQTIADALKSYMDKTDAKLSDHSERLRLVEFELNGQRKRAPLRLGEEHQ